MAANITTCNASTKVRNVRTNLSLRKGNRRRRRGMVLYFTTAAMVMLTGFCSLAVDLGRVEVVKAELRRSADAAARAAVGALPSDSAAVSQAIQYAKLNRADGQPVDLDPTSDIELGTWNSATRQFTVLTGAARTTANAVRVTARRTAARKNATPLLFGKLIGAGSCDATVSAIAAIKPRPIMNIVGINSVLINGNDRIDSYNSTLGAYSVTSSSDNVNVGSNGSISLVGSSVLHGDVYFASETVPSGPISGTTQKLDEALSYPMPVLPPSYTAHGAVSLGGGQTLTLNAGNHYFTSLSMSGSSVLNVTGPVKIFVQGSFLMSGNSDIAVAGNKPSNLVINVLGSAPVSLGHNNLFAVLYAPQSTLIMNGNAELFGSAVAGSIQMNGNNTIHYDESLTGTPLPPHIVLVK